MTQGDYHRLQNDPRTLRRSLSLDLAKELGVRGFKCLGYDPLMNEKDLSGLKGLMTHKNSFSEITEKPEVILLMTARPEFKEINWSELSKMWSISSQKRSLVLDTQNMLTSTNILKAGFDFKKLWSPLESARHA